MLFIILLILCIMLSLCLMIWAVVKIHKDHWKKLHNLKFMNTRGSPGCISKLCDWAVGPSRIKKYSIVKPRTIFVKADPEYWNIFFNEVLPQITQPFVLISGSADRTTPSQTDVRYLSYRGTSLEKKLYQLAKDWRVRKWFLENCDKKLSARMKVIPLGISTNNTKLQKKAWETALKPCNIRKRKISAICVNRNRDGKGQWVSRAKVRNFAKEVWKDYVNYYEQIPQDTFISKLAKYPFVICVEGGGMDPSPKAWEALIAGCIPIIRKTQIYDAYRDFPCAWVDNWSEDAITLAKLEQWLDNLWVWFDVPSKRNQILYQLTLKYWWCDVMGQNHDPFLYLDQ